MWSELTFEVVLMKKAIRDHFYAYGRTRGFLTTHARLSEGLKGPAEPSGLDLYCSDFCGCSLSPCEHYQLFLAGWKEWNRFLGKLSLDENINKRRASLVFLTGPAYYSADTKLSGLAFEIIDTLKGERDVIITKAVSWLLRSMVKNHKQAVLSYVRRNQGSLPKIAIRETMRKIQTGRK